MILYVGDIAWMIWPVLDGGLEDDSLVVAFALALRLDAIGTCRTLFTALDAAFSAGEAPSLGPLSHLRARGAWKVAGWGDIASPSRRSNVSVCHDASVQRTPDSYCDSEAMSTGLWSQGDGLVMAE